MRKELSDDAVITMKDLLEMIRKRKKFIFSISLTIAICGVLYPLSKPIKYEAAATFLDRGSASVGVGSSWFTLISGKEAASGETTSMLHSERLMDSVVKKLSMHVTVTDPKVHGKSWLRTVRDNWILYRTKKGARGSPIFPEIPPRITASRVQFESEYPLGVSVEFLENGRFQVLGGAKEKLGEGSLDSPFQWKHGKFTLSHSSGELPKKGEVFSISFSPVKMVSHALMKNLVTKPHPEGSRCLLLCSYDDTDRIRAAEVVNTVLEELEVVLIEEGQRSCHRQLRFLENRLEERETFLKKSMEGYAELRSEDLIKTGFMNAEDLLSFLTGNQALIQKRLLELDLELKRLENFDLDHCVYYDQVGTTADAAVINKILQKLRELGQQRDVIELAAPGKRNNLALEKEFFERQIAELERLRGYSSESESLLAALNANDLPKIGMLLQSSEALPLIWSRKIEESCNGLVGKEPTEEAESRWIQEKENLVSYLKDTSRMLATRQEIIEERLAHRRNSRDEFCGIDLSTAQELYITYTQSLDELDLQLRSVNFLLSRVKNPSVELTALSGLLNDPVTETTVATVTRLYALLHDEENRSTRELDRIRNEIAVQRDFLTSHLEQREEMLSLRKDLILDKIDAVQSMQLDLIHQQISLETKDLAEYVGSRLQNLRHERAVQIEHLDEMAATMAQVPKKWMWEQILNDKLELHKSVVKSISQLVESKVLQKNLESVQSSILDYAIPPLFPEEPRIKFFVLIGMVGGVVVGILSALVAGFMRGIPVSPEALSVQGIHASGRFSPKMGRGGVISDEDLAILRRINSECCKESGRLLLLEGKGPHYAPELAKLLSKKGEKVLLVPLSFDRYKEEEGTGVLQVVEEAAEKANVIAEEGFDRIPTGGVTRYSGEIVLSTRFAQMLQTLEKEYDRILLVSQAQPTSAEAEAILPLAQAMVVTLKGETVDQLGAYRAVSVPISFVFEG